MNRKRLFMVVVVGLLCGIGVVAPPPSGADEAYAGASWTIEQAAYTGRVEGDIARINAELTIKVLQNGYAEIPLIFGNAVITDVKAGGSSATLVVRDDQYALAVQKKGTYRVSVQFSTSLGRDDRYEQISVEIPQAVFSRLALEIPRMDLELAPDQVLTVNKEVRKESVLLSGSLGFSRQIHLRWAARPVKQDPVEPSFVTDLRVLATLEEEALRMTALVRYQVLQGELNSVAFDLPVGLTVLSVRGGAIEDWKAAPAEGVQRVTVSFRDPLKVGLTQLIVEAEQPITKSSTQAVFPSLVPLGSKRITGYLAVATGTTIELQNPAVEGLNRIDVREIPDDLRSFASAPLVAGFRYAQAPYRLTATLYQPENLAVLVAIAESGDLATILTPTGEAITRAIYQVRNNKKSSLAVSLPKGATLWSVLVDRRSVKPAAGPNGQLLVPLSVNTGPERSFPVEVVYVEKAAPFQWLGKTEYRGPVLDIPLTVVRWNLFMPEEVRGYWFSGNLQQHLKMAGFLSDPSPLGEARMQMASLEMKEEAASFNRVRANKMAARRFEDGEKSMLACDSAAPQSAAAGSFPCGEKDEMQDFRQVAAQVQQSGVLPFRIAIPSSGRAHSFSRLLTTGEPLTIRVHYVKIAPQVFSATTGGIGLAGFLLVGGGLRAGFRRRSIPA